MVILDGKKLSSKIKEEIKFELDTYESVPCLAVITIGDDEASKIYVNNKKKACEQVGIGFIHIDYADSVEEKKVISKIHELNRDKNVSGILLQLPIPERFDERRILNEISYLKDVDGLTDLSIGKQNYEDALFIPCTAKGIIEILNNYNIEISSKNVVVVGRSNLVGKPISRECLKRNATVTICHSKTNDLSSYTKNADILIVACGKKHIIEKSMVKKDSVIIDVGMNKIDGVLYGDVDPNVDEVCSYRTPVPGGVGPMTVAMLLKNTLIAFRKQKGL